MYYLNIKCFWFFWSTFQKKVPYVFLRGLTWNHPSVWYYHLAFFSNVETQVRHVQLFCCCLVIGPGDLYPIKVRECLKIVLQYWDSRQIVMLKSGKILHGFLFRTSIAPVFTVTFQTFLFFQCFPIWNILNIYRGGADKLGHSMA